MLTIAHPFARLRSRAGRWLRRAFPAAENPAHERLAAELHSVQSELQFLRTYHEPFHFRPGTLDRAIYREVVVENEYRLPDRFEPTDLIVDVGCHIGSFAAACLGRGAGRVVSFEAEVSNHTISRQNLARYGARADVRRVAVWRSDVPVEFLSFATSPDPANTGGGRVGGESGGRVPAVALDQVVKELTTNGGRIRLLKLDCEGSEYPILLTATTLDRVEELLGEYHNCSFVSPQDRVDGRDHYTGTDLKACLEANGFRVELRPNPRNPNVGEFFAKR
ncbi:MAG TPA: FkbM family methyltransferase [Fimbriiglobus sp.]|jgi:FkbM family methyltransferase